MERRGILPLALLLFFLNSALCYCEGLGHDHDHQRPVPETPVPQDCECFSTTELVPTDPLVDLRSTLALWVFDQPAAERLEAAVRHLPPGDVRPPGEHAPPTHVKNCTLRC